MRCLVHRRLGRLRSLCRRLGRGNFPSRRLCLALSLGCLGLGLLPLEVGLQLEPQSLSLSLAPLHLSVGLLLHRLGCCLHLSGRPRGCSLPVGRLSLQLLALLLSPSLPPSRLFRLGKRSLDLLPGGLRHDTPRRDRLAGLPLGFFRLLFGSEFPRPGSLSSRLEPRPLFVCTRNRSFSRSRRRRLPSCDGRVVLPQAFDLCPRSALPLLCRGGVRIHLPPRRLCLGQQPVRLLSRRRCLCPGGSQSLVSLLPELILSLQRSSIGLASCSEHLCLPPL